MSASRALTRSFIRQFSAQGPKPETRAHRFIANSAIASLVIVPFIPPALESMRQRKNGSIYGKKYPPLSIRI